MIQIPLEIVGINDTSILDANDDEYRGSYGLGHVALILNGEVIVAFDREQDISGLQEMLFDLAFQNKVRLEGSAKGAGFIKVPSLHVEDFTWKVGFGIDAGVEGGYIFE